MLTSMHQQMFYFFTGTGVVFFNGPDERGNLHKVGTCANDGDNLHSLRFARKANKMKENGVFILLIISGIN